MNYKNFERILRAYKKIQDTYSVLDGLGFDFYEGKFKLSGHTDDLLDEILKSHYTEEGREWINWFIFETNYGKEDMEGRDEKGKPICYDMKSTYEWCEQYRFINLKK